MDAECPCPHCGKPIRLIGSDTTPAPTDIRDMRVEDLPIKRRRSAILRFLKRKGINTLGQLVECTVDDFVDTYGFGETTLANLIGTLETLGLTLKGLQPDQYTYDLFKERRSAWKCR